jgi:hypothetical protein
MPINTAGTVLLKPAESFIQVVPATSNKMARAK